MGNADNDLVEVAVAGARLAHGAYRVACPLCEAGGHADKKTSMVVRADTGKWWCYRCGERGRLRSMSSLGAPQTRPKLRDEESPVFDPPEGFTRLSDSVGADSLAFRPALKYLESRNISAAAVKALHIGACADGYWGGRVIVPHLDADDSRTWRGWVGRVWVAKPREGVLPYRYPPGMRRTLFNARVLSEETTEPALAFEGALDVAHYHDRAFAFFGSPTPSHIEEIVRRARRPVAVVLDGDMGAPPGVLSKGDVLALRLRFEGVRAGAVRLGPREDPDEVDRDWLLEEARRCFIT